MYKRQLLKYSNISTVHANLIKKKYKNCYKQTEKIHVSIIFKQNTFMINVENVLTEALISQTTLNARRKKTLNTPLKKTLNPFVNYIKI